MEVRNRGRIWLAAVGGVLALVGAIVSPSATTPAAAAPASSGRFVALTPQRLLDTRLGIGHSAGVVPGGSSIDLVVASGAPVGGDATAVVLNVTVTQVEGAGYVTVSPTGSPRPNASNLNVDRPGQTVANLVVVPVGAGGRVTLFTSTTAHLLADVSGYFEPAATATSGRYQPLPPSRIVDTRLGLGARVGPLASRGSMVVAVRGHGGVPTTGASAVALNLTAVAATTPGWLQAYPSGDPSRAGQSSNLNIERVGQTVANLVVTPIGPDGTITLTGSASADLLVDVAGWFTDSSAASSDAGLFVPAGPVRLLDTRAGAPVAAGASIGTRAISTQGVDPASVGALVLNLTATDTEGVGYLTVWSGDGAAPIASNLNIDVPGSTVPNAAFTATASGANIRIFTSTGTHVLVDTAGYFTASSTTSPPTTTLPGPASALGTVTYQALRSSDAGIDRYQIRYVSQGIHDTLVEVGATVWVPTSSPVPSGGRPIVVLGHGPVGFSDSVGADPPTCVPSYWYGNTDEAMQWLAKGYVVAMTDYEGLGRPEPHPYMVGISAGRSMLDSARAAHNMTVAQAGTRVLAFGFSGGGHAALWTGELAATYAPELTVFGVMAIDPPSRPSQYVSDGFNADSLTTWVVYGQYAADNSLPVDAIVSPAKKALFVGIDNTCFSETGIEVYGADMFTVDPTSVPAWNAALSASNAGHRASPPVLLLTATGGLSLQMQDQYYADACAAGTSVTYRNTTGTHLDIWSSATAAAALAWADARLGGTAAGPCSQSGR